MAFVIGSSLVWTSTIEREFFQPEVTGLGSPGGAS